MFNNIEVNQSLVSAKNNGIKKPISRVTLWVDDETAYTAGDDTGIEVVSECPFATQEMADAVLEEIAGFAFQQLEATSVSLDPAAELGDGIIADGIHATIATVNDNGYGFPDVSAPGEAELEEEFPFVSPTEQKNNQRFAKLRSSITKTASEIRLEIQNEITGVNTSISALDAKVSLRIDGTENAISELELGLDGLATRVQDNEGNIAALELTTQEFEVSIQGLEGGYAELRLDLDGLTVSDEDGTTWINGASIKTGSITAAQIATGTITADNLVVGVVPTNVSDLNNDSGFQTANGVVSIVNGTVTADYVNALGVTAVKVTADTGYIGDWTIGQVTLQQGAVSYSGKALRAEMYDASEGVGYIVALFANGVAVQNRSDNSLDFAYWTDIVRAANA